MRLSVSNLAFGADHRASGRTAEALDRLRDRLADPVGDRVVETVRLAREVGGTDVGTVLQRRPVAVSPTWRPWVYTGGRPHRTTSIPRSRKPAAISSS